jgi:hypothetical protein
MLRFHVKSVIRNYESEPFPGRPWKHIANRMLNVSGIVAILWITLLLTLPAPALAQLVPQLLYRSTAPGSLFGLWRRWGQSLNCAIRAVHGGDCHNLDRPPRLQISIKLKGFYLPAASFSVHMSRFLLNLLPPTYT